MNVHSVMYFYDKKDECYYKILDFCTKVNVCFLECNTIELLAYLTKNIKPMFVIFDSNEISSSLVQDYIQTNKQCIIYIVQKNNLSFSNQNVYMVDNTNHLENLLNNHIHYYSNMSVLTLKDEKICHEMIHDELNRLSFRSKLIGAKYISELIYEILTTASIFNGKCSDLYQKLATKYNTSTGSIERAMRFSIQKAYSSSQNKNLFYEISKCSKAPTVKELTNYILDKIILQLNKRQAS